MHGGVVGGQQHSRADGGGGGGGGANAGGASSSSHYGVLGTCHSALAYYEAAAHGIMDELESGPTKGKVVSYTLFGFVDSMVSFRMRTTIESEISTRFVNPSSLFNDITFRTLPWKSIDC